MKTLAEIQSKFFNTVINNSDELLDEVKQQGEMTAEERVAIYVDGYRLRLIEALQDSYSALHTLMGDDDFERLCLVYIDQYPSQHFSIRYFGNQLAKYLHKNEAFDNSDLLQEMAQFEWALRGAFDAKDQAALKLDDLSQLAPEDWPELTFQLHPSLRILNLSWNVQALWKAIEQDADPQAPEQTENSVTWLIWRPELETFFRSMEKEEALGFDLIRQGKTFGQLCEFMSAYVVEPENAAQQAAAFLARWIEEGVFSCEKNIEN